jgi:transposase
MLSSLYVTLVRWISLSPYFGDPPIDDRLVLDAILWKIRNHAPWYDLPEKYPSHQTVYRRYRLWRCQDLLNKIFLALYTDLLQRGRLDPQRALQEGLIAVVSTDQGFRILASTELHGTWQLSTALVVIQLALTRLKSEFRNTERRSR